MAELHKALERLAPLDFGDVPTDNLDEYLHQHFQAGELICNSIPPPPGGNDLSSFKPVHTKPNAATSAKEVTASSARAPDPTQAHADLQSSWGKPYKFSAKDNPLNVNVFKMAAHDRHGAWFARRSVHEGISFDKMKSAMRREFLESLAVQGGPGAGAIRGIGVDSKLEDFQAGTQGHLQVYQLSAQFPGPTTPREFITMLMSTDEGLSSHSTNGKYVPRHFMVMSRPVTHPDAPERNGYIRGKYESVELIREIPLAGGDKSASTSNLPESRPSHEAGRDRGSTISFDKSRGKAAKGEMMDLDQAKHSQKVSKGSQLNPFEWIMVTRSDPGGGIPRFMVERGTPSSIIQDVTKLLDWACAKDDLAESDQEAILEKLEHEAAEPAANGSAGSDTPTAGKTEGTVSTEADRSIEPGKDQDGYVEGAKRMLEAGVDAYAPAQVANWLYSRPDLDSSSDSSSYASADDYVTAADVSQESLPLSETQPSTMSSSSIAITGNKSVDKEIHKIEENKRKLYAKAAAKKVAEDHKLAMAAQKPEPEHQKARERHSRELAKTEEKHAHEVSKLDAKREKELAKARKKAKKQADKDVLAKVSRERDDYRRRLDLVQKENLLLREQVGEIQKENTSLVVRLGRLEGVMEEANAARRRAGSHRSQGSEGSGKKSGIA